MKDVETNRLKPRESPFNLPTSDELVRICDKAQKNLTISNISYGFGANGMGDVVKEGNSWRHHESVNLGGVRDGYELEIDYSDMDFLNSCSVQFAGNGRIHLLANKRVLQVISDCIVEPSVSVPSEKVSDSPFSIFSAGQSLVNTGIGNEKLIWATAQNTLEIPFGGVGSNAVLYMNPNGTLSLQILSDGIDGAVYTFGE
jgi:hypothetical protein